MTSAASARSRRPLSSVSHGADPLAGKRVPHEHRTAVRRDPLTPTGRVGDTRLEKHRRSVTTTT